MAVTMPPPPELKPIAPTSTYKWVTQPPPPPLPQLPPVPTGG